MKNQGKIILLGISSMFRVEPEYEAKVFSDTIHLKVAKDNGDIIGLDAMEYIRKETQSQTAN